MRATRRLPLIALPLLLVLATPSTTQAGWPFNSNVNVPLCTAVADQVGPRAVSDGNGGAIVAWTDRRNGSGASAQGYDVYVQHVAGSGVVDLFWPVDGRALCTATGDQVVEGIASDGAGGAIVVWTDQRSGPPNIYVQRVNAAGVAQWTADGVPICTLATGESYPVIASDGAGGAIIAWADFRNETNPVRSDVYAQRVNASGATLWSQDGIPICVAPDTQLPNDVVPDGAGGAIIVWQDRRNGSDYDLYAQRVNAAGATLWTAGGAAVCIGGASQFEARAVPDGAGGATFAWTDVRALSNTDVYAQRLSATGSAKWAPGGAPVSVAAGDQRIPRIISDGAAGVIVSWQDWRSGSAVPYAERLSAFGLSVWTLNGVALASTAFVDQLAMVSDGSGGAIVAWADRSSGFDDILAQRVLDTGIIPGSWPANGRPLSTAANDQTAPVMVEGGGGRAIVAWQDYRTGSNWDIYAQLVAPSSYLGFPNPLINSVRDILWDQGGFVNVQWDASYLDTFEPYGVDYYWVLRSAPSGLVTSALAEGRVFSPEAFGAASAELRAGEIGGRPGSVGANGALVVTGTAAASYYWEPIRRIDALHAVPGYSCVTPTTSDSVPGGNPLTAFMVIAYNSTGTVILPSEPDSGYSVDNLAPGTPGHLTANVLAGSTHLHWDPNPDPDVAGYRVYRGGSADFVPTAATRVGSPPDTGFNDLGSSGSWYKLSAVDIHGNEGAFAVVAPATTGVAGGSVSVLALARPRPNPAHGASRITFALPGEARVGLAVFDLAGRLVRTLVEGAASAGEHAIEWDLRDRSGATVGAGLYLVRLEVEGRTLTERLVVAGR